MNGQLKAAQEALGAVIASDRVAGNFLIDSVVSQNDVSKIKKLADEQTYKLAVKVYLKLVKDLSISNNQQDALKRLIDSASGRLAPDGVRNSVFKAAHSLGIKLPSSSF